MPGADADERARVARTRGSRRRRRASTRSRRVDRHRRDGTVGRRRPGDAVRAGGRPHDRRRRLRARRAPAGGTDERGRLISALPTSSLPTPGRSGNASSRISSQASWASRNASGCGRIDPLPGLARRGTAPPPPSPENSGSGMSTPCSRMHLANSSIVSWSCSRCSSERAGGRCGRTARRIRPARPRNFSPSICRHLDRGRAWIVSPPPSLISGSGTSMPFSRMHFAHASAASSGSSSSSFRLRVALGSRLRRVVERGDAVVRGRRPAPARDGGDTEEQHGEGRRKRCGAGLHGSPFVAGVHDSREPHPRERDLSRT